MKYLQTLAFNTNGPGQAECPHCGRMLSHLVELTDSETKAVLDRGCESCVRRRNVW